MEYRFHVPQIFGIQQEPAHLPVIGDFRLARPRVFGQPDWDLILRAFVDGARVLQSDRAPFEENDTLLSVGFGAEVRIWRNVFGRFDLGMALRDSDAIGVDAGDTEAHFSVTTMY